MLRCTKNGVMPARPAWVRGVTENATFQALRQSLLKTVMFPGKPGAPDGRSNLGQRSSIVDWRMSWANPQCHAQMVG